MEVPILKIPRNIWELQHTTVCKVVGMAFDREDLKKIQRKFNLVFRHTPTDEEFTLHSAIVGMCAHESKLSRHVQKVIEKRFLRYALRLSRHAADEIAELVVNGDETSEIPLWAILWHLAINRLEDGERLETSLFGHIHMAEHKLLKKYWNRSEDDRDELERHRRDEINGIRKELTTLRSLASRLEKANQRLTVRLSESECRHACSSSASTVEQSGVNSIHTNKIERLKRLLDESREKNRELEAERSRSRNQIQALTEELVAHMAKELASADTSGDDACPCPLSHYLRGKRIAMVGGIDSLEAHYKNLVERSGGEFCRHDGRCCRGERKLEECIRNADLVVCPVRVTSHFAASGVKKACRRHGIKCCFPDSAGLGSLRATLVRHFTLGREAFGEAAPEVETPEGKSATRPQQEFPPVSMHIPL